MGEVDATVLCEAQDRVVQILRGGGNEEFYRDHYSKEEARYWGSIPEWLSYEIQRGSCQSPRILDLGCAYGTLLEFCDILLDRCGSDGRSLKGLDVCRFDNSLNPRIETHDYISQPIPAAGSWDIIICTEVIEHFPFSPLVFLGKIREALSTTGILLLSTPIPGSAFWGIQGPPLEEMRQQTPEDIGENTEHFKLYTHDELESLLHDAGFYDWMVTSPSLTGHHAVWARR